MANRQGRYTVAFDEPPAIAGFGAFVGKKEKEGPLGSCFAHYDEDTTLGCCSWEQSESELQRRALQLALRSAGRTEQDIDLLFGGDLLNQCIASGYGICETDIPFAGLYGACSTMAEGIALAAVMCDGGAASLAGAVSSSHFCAAERQFRFPLEYGGMRAPASQWTVTGSGCVLLQQGNKSGHAVRVNRVCFGAVRDLGICDINNMGGAMAPAAADTLTRFFKDTESSPQHYDAVFTGDLGQVGSRILPQLLAREGYELDNHRDCGCLIFDRQKQQVKSGGSGAGCCASVLCGHILPAMLQGAYRRVLFAATGALMSTTSFQQGSSIPAVAHLVELVCP
ncbi:MAG: stage V sporulation protein AD [Oscillospiraceae bacterium]|nr:stage V sporulation protein AD [Oscillospiraceae bacterium]